MSALSRQALARSEIKSITLADLQFDPPSPYNRLAGLAKAGLMLWGALTFGVSVGTAAFYFVGASGEPTLASETTGSIGSVETPDDGDTAALAEIPPHLSEFVDGKDKAIEEARLPRPRPDEPVFTGSVARADLSPRPAAARGFGPCEALNQIGASLAFHVRCQRQAYAPPPPPRYYYEPRPYYPPYVVR